MTQVGTVMGTPRYMSPEQFTAGEVDWRSDIFSFCVALYHALFRTWPFAGKDAQELEESVLHGAPAPPPRQPRVPQRLRRAVLRGLARDPAQRPQRLEEILEILAWDPGARWRRAGLAAAALITISVGSWGVLRSGSRGAQPCAGGAALLAGVWDDERHAAVRTSLLATNEPSAPGALRGVERALGRFVETHGRMYREACEATRVRGEQSEELLDLRMACLAQRRQEVVAIVEPMTHADTDVVRHAVGAAESVDLAPCADLEGLRAPEQLPSAPDARARVTAAYAAVARAGALYLFGKTAAAVEDSARALAQARETGYGPVVARALITRGDCFLQHGDAREGHEAFVEAELVADEAHDDRARASAATQDAYALGDLLRDHDGALRASARAFAVIRRAHLSNVLVARLLSTEAQIQLDLGRPAQAMSIMEPAWAIMAASADADSIDAAWNEHNLGYHLMQVWRLEEGLARVHHARTVLEAALGSEHPQVGHMLTTEGAVALWDPELCPEAIPVLERARVITPAGTMHRLYALQNLGACRMMGPDYAAGRAILDEAIAGAHKLYGADSEIEMQFQGIIAMTARRVGRYADATTAARELVRLVEKLRGPSLDLVDSLTEAARIAALDGRTADAAADLTRAEELAAKVGAVPEEMIAALRLAGAQVARAQGDTARAAARLEEARHAARDAGVRARVIVREIEAEAKR
jgi:tetratricopeptide (TPR) repeat protein